MTRNLDASHYRYICALQLCITTLAITYIFSQKDKELRILGVLAAIIFLANPISFYVFHLTRPETFHTVAAILAIACCSSFPLNLDGFDLKSNILNSRQLSLRHYVFLVFAMLLNLSLPHVHMFGIVHMPATYVFIMWVIMTLPWSLFIRLGTGAIFTVIEFLDILPFLQNSPSFNLDINIAQRTLLAFSNIYNQPASLSLNDSAVHLGNKMSHLGVKFFSYGQHLKVGTALLLILGILGSLVTLARSITTKSFDIRTALGLSIVIFFATFFASIFKMGYMNFSYIVLITPWAAMGCALGLSSLIKRPVLSFKKHVVSKHSDTIGCKLKSYQPMLIHSFFVFITIIALFTIILIGLGQVYTYSWPLRHSHFSRNVEAIRTALIENQCNDVPYISAPYEGFVSMLPGKKEIKFAPDFIVLYTSNLNFIYESHFPYLGYFYDKTIDRINKPGACLVVSANQLFSLGTFGTYADSKVVNFIIDNFSVVKQIHTHFYDGDPFPSVMTKKFNYDIQLGAPFLHHGSMENIFILKTKKIIDINLIAKYVKVNKSSKT